MLLLPIGREDAVVRRHAWVFYGILILNVLAFIAFNLIGENATDYRPINEKAQELFTWLSEHPYLEPSDELSETIDPAILAQLRNANTGRPSPEASTIASEQERLDTLSLELRDMVRSTPVLQWAFYPDDPSVLKSITALFMHGDLFHLLGNMLFLFVTAPFIEDVFGRPLFTFLYLSGGLVATWAHAAQSGSNLPLIGASGAVAAIMGAYLVRFFRTRLEFIFIPLILRPTWSYRFFMPAFIFLPFWFGRELLSATTAGASGVAFWAHVGGFAYGAVFAFGLRLTGIEEKYIHPKIEGQISWSASAEVEQASSAWREGNVSGARQTLAKFLIDNPSDIDARQLLVEISLDTEDWNTAGAQARTLLEHYMKMKELELARNLAWNLQPHLSHLPIPLLSKCAAVLDRLEDQQTALDFWEEIAKREGESQTALRALIQTLRIQISLGRSSSAGQTLDMARRHPLCDGGWREAVEVQAARLEGSGGPALRIPIVE